MAGKLRELLRRLATPPVRIDLDVPFACKDQVKALGARWDPAKRTWYVNDRDRLDLFARWMPSSGEYERTYLHVPFDDKEQVRLLGARWDATGRRWYVPSGIDTAPFVRWLEEPEPSPLDVYRQRSSEQARYHLLRDDGGMSAGIHLDDLAEAQRLASGALAEEAVVELRDNVTQEVWQGADILTLKP